MNTINSIARCVIPVQIYDVGVGIYHICKKDLSQDQCQKLVEGAVRIGAVTGIILAGLVGPASLAAGLCLPVYLISNALDNQTGALFLTFCSLGIGMVGLSIIISNLAKGIFADFEILLLGQILFLGGASYISVSMNVPRGILTTSINGQCKEWSDNLFIKCYEHGLTINNN